MVFFGVFHIGKESLENGQNFLGHKMAVDKNLVLVYDLVKARTLKALILANR